MEIKSNSPLLTVLALICTGLFWIFTINGLPKRVDRLEAAVKILEQKLERNDVKTDMILDTVKIIQAHLLHYIPGRGSK